MGHGTWLLCTWAGSIDSHLQEQLPQARCSLWRGTRWGTCSAPRRKGTRPCQGNKGPCCVTASTPAPRAVPHSAVLHHGERTWAGRVLPLGCPSALPTDPPHGQALCQGNRAMERLLGCWLGGPYGATFHLCRFELQCVHHMALSGARKPVKGRAREQGQRPAGKRPQAAEPPTAARSVAPGGSASHQGPRLKGTSLAVRVFLQPGAPSLGRRQ
ncbi:uncharacterized protein LOC110399050 [Numida meleagris]|uniref:uncharacterized protein LOC110399050 n=1 Tax=Numida meleagris TaxID=8996 RepID=UPI000B3D851A|nr:uncharacterized protein LOC110399050 [Numida meleagris]